MIHRKHDQEEEKLLGITCEHKAVSSPSDQNDEEEATWRNFPHKRQLLLVSLCRLSTPLSNACLLPYLYDLVKSVISDPNHPKAPQEISQLTGLLVAAFPIGQVMTSMLWGRLSDEYGRKPIILFGLATTVICNIAFGFSRSIGLLLFWRVLAGMANGTLGVMRTMTAELGGRKHQSRAFLAPPVVFNSGRVIALAVGGCLANPAANLPALFGPTGLFNLSRNENGVAWTLKYPYALPALFNGVSLSISLVAATIWMRESLPARQNERVAIVALGFAIKKFVLAKVMRRATHDYSLIQINDSEKGDCETPTTDLPEPKLRKIPRPAFRDIWTPQLGRTLFAFSLLPLHNTAFLHIFPVFLSMPVVIPQTPASFSFTGGLGLASPTVGLFLAALGIIGILLQLFTYPVLHKRIGTLGIFRLANCIFPIAYMAAPYLALLAGHGLTKWVAMIAVLFTQVLARTMAIPGSVMLLTNAAPHRSVLGTVHGAGNTLSALASAVGPAVAGVILAKGIEMGAIGLVWWTWLCSVATGALVWSLFIKSRSSESDEQ